MLSGALNKYVYNKLFMLLDGRFSYHANTADYSVYFVDWSHSSCAVLLKVKKQTKKNIFSSWVEEH